MGGYLAAVYALAYPEDLSKLLLLSPVGIPEKPDSFTNENVVNGFQSVKARFGARMALNLWQKNYTPFGIMRKTGSFGTKFMLNYYLKNRMASISDPLEYSEMKAYLHQIFLRPPSGEYALNALLEPGAFARSPLINRLPFLEVPVAFFYGELDWMDASSAVIMQ